jgi:dTDP-4-dehydrorhamnose 3,5-epimerase
MRIQKTEIPGLCVIETEPSFDERGSFSRIYCSKQYEALGLDVLPDQTSLSYNHQKGIIRGLHFQAPPFAESKIVTCATGAAFDVVLDLRSNSPMYGRALWFQLNENQGKSIYVPKGCAHGFQTLADHTLILYMISPAYNAKAAKGVRWDDPNFGIPWPLKNEAILSKKDRMLPLLSEIKNPF